MEIKQKILAVSGIIAAISVFFSAGFTVGTQRAASRVSLISQSTTDAGSTAGTSRYETVLTEAAESSTETTQEHTQPATQETDNASTAESSVVESAVYPVTKIPENTREAVELFNAAANRIKSQKPTVYMTRDYFQISNGLFGKTDVTSLLSKLNRNDQSKKEILPAEFPVGGESWASRLQPEAVQSAECLDGGDTLQVKIVLKPESGVPLRSQSNHGSCFSIPANFDFLNVDISGIKIGELMLTYSGCSISCLIDKSTGQLTRADYHIQADGALQLTLASIIKKDCSAKIISDTSFEIDWD